MTAPKGYYRQLLSNTYPMIRIAFTHTPMHNVTRVNCEGVLKVLDGSSDEYAKYYANGLRSGEMVTIVENSDADRYFKSGELYFTT